MAADVVFITALYRNPESETSLGGRGSVRETDGYGTMSGHVGKMSLIVPEARIPESENASAKKGIAMAENVSRRSFVGSVASVGAVASAGAFHALRAGGAASPAEDAIARWNRETEAVSPEVYGRYLLDGDTRGYAALENLEQGFGKVMREIGETTVTGDVPAVWSVYNMGYVVKTRSALFQGLRI